MFQGYDGILACIAAIIHAWVGCRWGNRKQDLQNLGVTCDLWQHDDDFCVAPMRQGEWQGDVGKGFTKSVCAVLWREFSREGVITASFVVEVER